MMLELNASLILLEALEKATSPTGIGLKKILTAIMTQMGFPNRNHRVRIPNRCNLIPIVNLSNSLKTTIRV
ncbi:hypothetical protein COE25_23150 [Bacillus sp. AFS031507]|nr:hypothetical protein COE25_23150 [Bacillus sp. AFS031507]